MTIVTLDQGHPLDDGRQSERALLVRRGVERLFFERGASLIAELPLASGRRADLIALMPDSSFVIVEVKSSIADFRADSKWHEYRLHCDRLYFATLPDVPAEIFPQEAGFILSDGYGAEIMREAPEEKLASATRKALLTRFARTGADRLLRASWAGMASGD